MYYRDEYGKLYDFVTQKKLRVKNIGGKIVSEVFYVLCKLLTNHKITNVIVDIATYVGICGEKTAGQLNCGSEIN